MPALTDNELKAKLADVLRQDVADLPAAWDSIISQANTYAENFVSSALAALGYSPAQLAVWDQYTAYVTDLGLWRALTKGALLIDFPQEKIDALDVRKDLRKEADPPFQYTAGGVVQPPAAALTDDPVGGRGVASGRIAPADSRLTMNTVY